MVGPAELDQEAEALRNVTLRHLLWLMLPAAPDSQRLIQSPIRIAGAPALCALSVVDASQKPVEAAPAHRAFWHTYYLVNSVIDHSLRTIRVRYREKYVDCICEAVEQAILAVVQHKRKTGRAVSLLSVAEHLNREFKSFTRVFPYNRVTVSYGAADCSGEVIAILGHPFSFEIQVNEYFDVIGNGQFLKLTELANEVRARVNDVEFVLYSSQVNPLDVRGNSE